MKSTPVYCCRKELICCIEEFTDACNSLKFEQHHTQLVNFEDIKLQALVSDILYL